VATEPAPGLALLADLPSLVTVPDGAVARRNATGFALVCPLNTERFVGDQDLGGPASPLFIVSLGGSNRAVLYRLT
jgi:hypothetical protein